MAGVLGLLLGKPKKDDMTPEEKQELLQSELWTNIIGNLAGGEKGALTEQDILKYSGGGGEKGILTNQDVWRHLIRR